MKKYGLIGAHLPHSYSPQIHGRFGSYSYELCEVSEEELPVLLKDEDFGGFNVTIPYKKTVMKYCDELSTQAKEIGSVNTVVRMADGRLKGYNTDYYGFVYLLQTAGIDVAGRKCLVLGSGGASVTVQAALRSLEASEVVVISRSGENNYENISRHLECEVMINTTPVGMYPNNGQSPIDLDAFPNCKGVVDLIYNPNCTKLVLDAMERSIPATGGLAMLVAQAKEASELFQGIKIEDEACEEAVESLRKQMLNMVLIGMPGCGKTFVGKVLAKKHGRKLVDIDKMIVKREGMIIPEIFAQKGEDYFRQVETEILAEVCKESGLVISTGGGVIKRDCNYPLVKQNGVIYWVQRDLDKLATAGRPLSLSVPLEQLYAERKDAYASWSDGVIDNNKERRI
ncbi:MAG: shikimate kinase [Firmicutes bacterium]|nr:shikimate kinase [Bacillota bacterium]